MKVKASQDFKWSHNGRILSFKKDQILEVAEKDGSEMINCGVAYIALKEIKTEDHENKMIPTKKRSKKKVEEE